MKKIILICTFLILTNGTFAKNNTINTEALENINISLERIETAITTLTSQNEETVHNQKQTKSETITLFKDIQLQINEIKEEQSKISQQVQINKIEIENLKNIIFMVNDKVKEIKKQPEPQKENNIPTIATQQPTDLLIQQESSTIEQPKENPSTNLNDEESFKKAIDNFNKKDFTESAINFANNIKNFPESKNFHNNLLHLGLSMKELGNKNNACTAFAKIINSQENIEKEIKDKAQTSFTELQCNPNEPKEVNTNNVNK